MTSYLTIDNNKFGPYLDYPPNVRNYKLLITNVFLFSFNYVQLSTRTKTSKAVGQREKSAAREPPFVELVSFLVLEDI